MPHTPDHSVITAIRLPDLEERPESVLAWARRTLEAQYCTLYRRDPVSDRLQRVASAGSPPNRPSFPDLIRRVVQTRAPVRTAEIRRGAYLGLPLVRRGEVLGVIESWRLTREPFSDDDEALVLTLALRLGAHYPSESIPRDVAPQGEQALYLGVPAAPGIALGTVLAAPTLAVLERVPDRAVQDGGAEREDFEHALEAVRGELHTARESLPAHLPEEVSALYGVYGMILADPELAADVLRGIEAGLWAPAALRNTILHRAAHFEAMQDPYLRARAEDVRAVGRRLLWHLRNAGNEPEALPQRIVLLGEGVGLTCIAAVPTERLAGLACSRGSALSHGAIVARALGIPAVAGLEGLAETDCNGHEIVLDGYRGRAILDPAPEVRAEFHRLQAIQADRNTELRSLLDLPARSRDGRRVALEANLSLLDEIPRAQAQGAEGVGLYRTEFPFLLRRTLPGEETQYAIYREILASFAPRPVTMRTLDAGGDKALPYLPAPEVNPALGLRGIRLCLDHPELFHLQLRALLRADAGLGNLRLLLPMVTLPQELEATRTLLNGARDSLLAQGLPAGRPPVGIMVEVPAAVFRIDELAAGADFISIGTNDLTQYILAADRTNPAVEPLCDPFTPALLSALSAVLDGARRREVEVSVCGEMAGDPLGALLLFGAGVERLSMACGNIPRVKQVIHSFTVQEANLLWTSALECSEARQVRRTLAQALKSKGMGNLIDPAV